MWVNPRTTIVLKQIVIVLGIVQDDPNELQQEIANQGKIYRNGTVTILADVVASAEQGFLHRRTFMSDRFVMSIQLPDGEMIQLRLDRRPAGLILATVVL